MTDVTVIKQAAEIVAAAEVFVITAGAGMEGLQKIDALL